MQCRSCNSPLNKKLIDLGSAPPSNAYLTKESLKSPESSFPLRVLICHHCWLVQTEDYAKASQLFDSDYSYFSGFSKSWLLHAKNYVDKMITEFGICEDNNVLEIAANDGYLLQYFQKLNIPCYGVEPTSRTASAAREKGLSIVEDFFGVNLAKKLLRERGTIDLIIANNVLAHVPDINDFVKGFSILLAENGIATFEFPHFLKLFLENQFDTIYHEHFSYLSLTSVKEIFSRNNLIIFDVEEIPTHGGSLRVFAQKTDTVKREITNNVMKILLRENEMKLFEIETYNNFQSNAEEIKNNLIMFLIESKKKGKKVAAYGAAAKGNTLLNFAGVRGDLISYVVDRNPSKIGKYMPGSRIPIVKEEFLISDRPDFVLILPWNLKNEIKTQLNYLKDWGGQLLVALPNLEFL